MRTRYHYFGFAIALAILCGCDRPTEGPDAAVTPATPAFPEWVAPYLGRNIAEVFALDSDTCTGFANPADPNEQFTEATGVRVDGWGWSITNERAYSRIVATDDAGIIQGAGDGGFARPDVPQAMRDITDPNTGYSIVTRSTSGTVSVFGIDEANHTACRIGGRVLS